MYLHPLADLLFCMLNIASVYTSERGNTAILDTLDNLGI